ncbi:MAG: AbrB/MazE/SpoVT family DNA-binding domain-containing protein [Candidatus Bathyarchaeia archaeon]
MAVVKMDSQGRFYLPKAIRRAAGIDEETLLEVTASEGQIILRVREAIIAKTGRGIFRIKRHIEDVDGEIEEGSLQRALGEMNEIRRR